jgi:hypothetical protein
LGTIINRVPFLHFYKKVVVEALRKSPQFNDVAKQKMQFDNKLAGLKLHLMFN